MSQRTKIQTVPKMIPPATQRKMGFIFKAWSSHSNLTSFPDLFPGAHRVPIFTEHQFHVHLLCPPRCRHFLAQTPLTQQSMVRNWCPSMRLFPQGIPGREILQFLTHMDHIFAIINDHELCSESQSGILQMCHRCVTKTKRKRERVWKLISANPLSLLTTKQN